MFQEIEYEVVEELKFGPKKNPGTWLRLEKSPKGKHVIRCWSGAGKDKYWKVMYRYDVLNAWESWKKTHASLSIKRHKK